MILSNLSYDIANLAYIIANARKDRGENIAYTRIIDICQPGNRDRVARVAGIAYLVAMTAIEPLIVYPYIKNEAHFTSRLRDYEIKFRKTGAGGRLSALRKLKIVELIREFIVTRVLADWLSFLGEEGAEEWRLKGNGCIDQLLSILSSSLSSPATLRRRVPPI